MPRLVIPSPITMEVSTSAWGSGSTARERKSVRLVHRVFDDGKTHHDLHRVLLGQNAVQPHKEQHEAQRVDHGLLLLFGLNHL
jgi:hypothetical protein